jgi:DNA-binding transcriptional regulator GbsR (MarR family)
MKTQELKHVHQLAKVVGGFIRYWGFRNIHGEIWTVLFLSKTPLAAVEIGAALQVSKALVSPALKELMTEGLIKPAPSENSKIKRYQAVEDVTAVIRDVLKRREQPMLADAAAKYESVQAVAEESGGIDSARLQFLGNMIGGANFALMALVNEDDYWKV